MEEYTLGAIESPIDLRDYKGICCVSNIEFPKEFELYRPPIKNQQKTSSCVAHALSSVVEYFNHEQEENDTTFSTSWIYGNRKNSDHKGKGMVTSDAINNLRKYGDCPIEFFDGNEEVPGVLTDFEQKVSEIYPEAYPHRITSYFSVSNKNDIKSALMEYGPVVIAVNWYNDTTCENGILKLGGASFRTGGHCMYIYGWNEIGWKVANSWGESWGSGGSCILPYDQKIREAYGIEDKVMSDKMKDEKIAQLKAKIQALSDENAALRKSIQDKMNEIYQLYKDTNELTEQLNDLKTKLSDLSGENSNLNKEKEELVNKINETNNLLNEKLNLIEELKNTIKELQEDQSEKVNQINEFEKTIEQLKEQLIEVQKPFQSDFMQLIAKILNWFLNLFK